jgi:hypothetical protein
MPQPDYEEAAATQYEIAFWEEAVAGIPDDGPQPTQATAMNDAPELGDPRRHKPDSRKQAVDQHLDPMALKSQGPSRCAPRMITCTHIGMSVHLRWPALALIRAYRQSFGRNAASLN